ncbi:MAG: hypothetical protein JSS68_20065 [Actinobacteria bacterium]|nr:hypothetical protein [Actinomycetota bacterium]
MGAGAGPRFAVRADDSLLGEDLVRVTKAARAAIEPVVAEVLRDGVPYEWLRRCEEEGHDGTRLGGCVKFYIPRPAGQWGAVLAGDEEARRPALVLVAVGERHPAQRWKPSVYEIAHRRLNRDN